MKAIVVGLGVQGYKRKKFAGDDFVASVDPVNQDADYRAVEDVPLADYDAALCCIPDEPKIDILKFLLSNGKHVLVEKPLWAAHDDDIAGIEKLAQDKAVLCRTAYNHRFEPHFARMRDLIVSGRLGEIYRCRMFYGNGTARLVRDSDWRDAGAGVLPDLGSHLLDTARFWFGDIGENFHVVSADAFENKSPDHVVIQSTGTRPKIELEMTLLSWRNDFTCDIHAEKGSAHIRSLCKWGPSVFTFRERILPSGRPPEHAETLVREDPTWSLEYDQFRAMCRDGQRTDLSRDIWLNRLLRNLGGDVVAEAGR